jgi:hypothetical protein
VNDTSPDAQRVLTGVLRNLPPGQKWCQLGELFRDARLMHAAGHWRRHGTASAQDVLADWMAVSLGCRLVATGGGTPMTNLPALREVIAVLDRLGIAYALGGSMASSVFGVPRFTHDADITVEVFAGREGEFSNSFGPDYYLSLVAIQDAVRRRSSFNIINTATGFKIDVFVRQDLPFEQSAMARRIAMTFPDAPEQPVVLYSAEDVVLFKLRWYRLGGETSEQQWKDVLGVLRVQAERLDEGYLDHWASDLGLNDLLGRARQEAAPPP